MRNIYILALILFTISCKNLIEENSSKMENEVLFVGTYTDKEGHVDGHADGIYALEFDTESGTLSKSPLKASSTNPSYIAIDRKNGFLYAVNEKVGKGETISSFAIKDSTLVPLNKVDALGGAPCHIHVSDTYLMTANYVGGNHAIYNLKANGHIGDTLQVIQNNGQGPSPRQESAHAHMITQNPNTKDFVSVDLGTDKVSFYTLNKESKRLENKSTLKMKDGSGPRHLAFHPKEDILYILNELSGQVAVAKEVDGKYEVVQNIDGTMKGDPSQAGSAAIHVHENGKFLYFSNRGPYNSIAQFEIAEDGLLAFGSEISTEGEAPRDFTIDPSGKFLLAANQNSDNILVFKIDQESGELSKNGQAFEAPTPVCLKFF